MNILKQIASRGLIYVLAIAIVGSGLMLSNTDNVTNAETLSSVYLTNKGTSKTTEASPSVARTAPSSRVNASTVYVTMTDVDTANGVKNSHILNANKVVVTVVEPDMNIKVNVLTGDGVAGNAGLVVQAANLVVGKIHIVSGSSNNPVIDSDSDGDLSDEIYYTVCSTGTDRASFNGTTFAGGNCAGGVTTEFVTASVANGASATAAVAPQITAIVSVVDAANDENDDEIFAGYKSSAVNTFQVTAWSTVQLEANASLISVVETGRNTGVFEAEFVVADTEGVNDNMEESMITSINQGAAVTNTACGSHKPSIVVAAGTPADGRFDASSGTNADCEIRNIAEDQDLGATIAAGAEGTIAGTYNVLAGEFLIDEDGDGSILDSVYFIDDADASDIANGNQGLLMNVTSLVCSTVADCGVPHTADRTITIKVTPPVEITHTSSDVADVLVLMGNNVVDQQKVDTTNSGGVTTADSISGRVGSDTQSILGSNGLGTSTAVASNFTGVFLTGVDRTPVVEAQANATITVQYVDTTNNTSTASSKVKATVTVDASQPTVAISSPSNGASFKDRQPVFVGSASDIGSGLDVSTTRLFIDMDDDAAADGLTTPMAGSVPTLAASWLGGAGAIDLKGRYDPMAVTLDNTTTMVDGVKSVTWTVATSANIPCSTVTAENSTEYPTAVNNTGVSGTHTNFANAVSCNVALAEPDFKVDYAASVTDLAGNRGFSDSKSTDSDAAGGNVGDTYVINIDEKKPDIEAATTLTGKYWDSASTSIKSNELNRLVVGFDDELSATSAAAFQVTLDAGTVLTPTAAEVGTKGTTAAGVAYDERKKVFLTLPSNMASDDTPKVTIVGDVTDLAGNSTKSGKVDNTIDKIKPTLTMTVSGGSGTGTGSNASDKLTKSAMTFTITTSEVLSAPPDIQIWNEAYGTGGGGNYSAAATLSASADLTATAAGASKTITIAAHTIIDTDKDGSLLDEVILGQGSSNPVPLSQLQNLAVTAVAFNGTDDVDITITNNNTVALTNNFDQVSITAPSNPDLVATSVNVAEESPGGVTAVAQDSLTYTGTFAGSGFTDTATTDTKAIVISATDASTDANTATIGKRDNASSSAYAFRLDKTAPVLGNANVTTTLPRPYVIYEFTDNSDVTVVTASFGGDDVLAKLATTNNKKYFMVPDADLTSQVYAVKAKGTDLAGNAGGEGSYNLKVTSRKDYKATILAGWNLMSFPSDPVSSGVGSVFTNAGIDQVVGYDAMAKGSPWTVATKDTVSGTYSGALSSIASGNGYWVHSTEFSTQSVALTGPEGPSASAPPSIASIDLASGWNLIGVTDPTKALTQANEGTCINTIKNYLGADGGSSVTKAYEYNTTALSWAEVTLTGDTACTTATDGHQVDAGEAFWVFATPAASGLLTPIVP
jgi:hypothetical protein